MPLASPLLNHESLSHSVKYSLRHINTLFYHSKELEIPLLYHKMEPENAGFGAVPAGFYPDPCAVGKDAALPPGLCRLRTQSCCCLQLR